tara:strand:+ start:414 stop:1337 length:924 start_codon:yes stop_codon:yes gene_type:complete
MIANFFKKSNYLNYFISGFLILLGAFSNQFEAVSAEGSLSQIYASTTIFLIAFSVMIFMDVYLKQQNFFKKSSDYKMLYALLFVAIPVVKINLYILLAPFLIFFSIYNMNLSFASKTKIKPFFDTGLFITFATLLYPFNALLFIIPFLLIITSNGNQSKRLFLLFLPLLVIAFIAYPIFSILEIDRIQEDLGKWTWELKSFDLPLESKLFWYGTIGFGLLMSIVDLLKEKDLFGYQKQNHTWIILFFLIVLFMIYGTNDTTLLFYLLFPISIFVGRVNQRMKSDFSRNIFPTLIIIGIILLKFPLFN